jgi:hypothetical protein
LPLGRFLQSEWRTKHGFVAWVMVHFRLT